MDSDPSTPRDESPADTAGGMLAIDIRRKVYRGVTAPLVAVEDLALRLEAGRFGAILGESGCGKSTVLRIAAGLDGDFEGSVRRPGKGRLGIVFQEPRLLPWRTVEQNVRLALPAALAHQDLTDLFAALGLAEHRDRHPGELSLGLARRAALARAFAVQPDLLLLDEPFVSLDPATAARMRGQLVALIAARPCTTLMVTHDQDEALALADRVFVLSSRPARLLADLALTRRRPLRDAAWMEDRRRDLANLRASSIHPTSDPAG